MEPANGETFYGAVWEYRFTKRSNVEPPEKPTTAEQKEPKYEYHSAFSSEPRKTLSSR